jgi:catechol 2,3-dioxygenase-like lactoylglutathione lyase family enzyme
MSLIKVHTFMHVGIPANDLRESTEFYTEVLGLNLSEEPGRSDSPVRLHCGDEPVSGQQVILFKRPKPITRDAVAEDGSTHHAFVTTTEDFDRAMVKMQEMGIFHRGPIQWPGSAHRTLYFFDPAGNYIELADSDE